MPYRRNCVELYNTTLDLKQDSRTTSLRSLDAWALLSLSFIPKDTTKPMNQRKSTMAGTLLQRSKSSSQLTSLRQFCNPIRNGSDDSKEDRHGARRKSK